MLTNTSRYNWIFPLTVFALIASLPILNAGFYADDIINSLLGGMAAYHINFWRYIMMEATHWLEYGRFYPLSMLASSGFFYLFPDQQAYQIIRIVFIWLSLGSFAYVVKLQTRNNAAAILFLFLTPVCWSIRPSADPLTSFAILLPLTTLFSGLSLVCAFNYWQTQNNSWRLASALAFTLAISTYELGFITLLLVGALAYVNQQQVMKTLRPFLLISCVYAFIILYLRFNHTVIYDGIQFGISAKFFKGFLIQLFSALPLSYYWVDRPDVFSYALLLKSLPLMVVFFISVRLLLRRLAMTKQAQLALLVMALICLMFPAFLIGINQKYQVLVTMGRGYILVYMQYIGFSLLLLWLLTLFVRLRFVLVSVLSIVLGFSFMVNHVVVAKNNTQNAYRNFLETSLAHGLLSDFPEDGVLIERMQLWNNAEFYLLHTHKLISPILDVNDLQAIKQSKKSLYLLEVRGANSEAIFGEITGYQYQWINGKIAIMDAVTLKNPSVFKRSASKVMRHKGLFRYSLNKQRFS